jgi:hypothetical protein
MPIPTIIDALKDCSKGKVVMNPSVRARPALLRALGRDEPPPQIELAAGICHRIDVLKHDSWAATARYRGANGDVICKFNRVQPILGLPMAWLGRRLARREALALRRLADVPGIPAECGPVFAGGRRRENAVAHAYIPGHPLGVQEQPSDQFFPELRTLLEAVHRQNMAYMDLHKRENIVVGEDKKPYLVDFQVYFGLSHPHEAKNPVLRSILRALQQGDRYNLAKHVRRNCPNEEGPQRLGEHERRPWWIQVHRLFAVPLRRLRRSLLVALGVRAKGGRALTEAFPEDAIRQELKRAG